MEEIKKADQLSTKSCPECERKEEELSRLNRVTQRCQSCTTCHSPESLKGSSAPPSHAVQTSHGLKSSQDCTGSPTIHSSDHGDMLEKSVLAGAPALPQPSTSNQQQVALTQSDAVLHRKPDSQYGQNSSTDQQLGGKSSPSTGSMHEKQPKNPEDALVKRGCSPKSIKPEGEPVTSPKHLKVDRVPEAKGNTGSQLNTGNGTSGKTEHLGAGAIPKRHEIPHNLVERKETSSSKTEGQTSSPMKSEHDQFQPSQTASSPKSGPKSERHYSAENHGRTKTKHAITTVSPVRQLKTSSPKHYERGDPDRTLSSDLQSHPVTQPTDQLCQEMSEYQEPNQEASFNDIVAQLHSLQRQFQQLNETKTVLESDLIKLQQKYHSVTKELRQEIKQLRGENEALRQNQKDADERREAETKQLLALSMQSDLSDMKEFIHVEKLQKTKDNEDSLLMSLKQLDEKDRLLEKYKTHMQKLASANQSWYEQHQLTEKEHQEQLAALQVKLDELKLENQEQKQILETELQHEKEQRIVFEKMYQTSQDRLEAGPQQLKERAERAERELMVTNKELRAAKEQLVKLLEEKDRLNQENRKLQTAAWLKESVPMPEGGPSPAVEQMQTQVEVLRHQASTWKEDFERERKDRTRAQAEKEHYKKKVETLQIEIQNLNYRVDSLTHDLQSLRKRNLELEKKHYQPPRSSTAPAYTPHVYRPTIPETQPSAVAEPELNILEYPSDHPLRWNCRKCTYSNIPERSSCELCGASRGSRRAHTAPQATTTGNEDITFPHYHLSRDVVPDQNYMRH